MMYIALITVFEDYYQDETKKRTEIHIVEASTKEEAIDKLEHHYEMQDSEYYMTHRIEVESINEVIR